MYDYSPANFVDNTYPADGVVDSMGIGIGKYFTGNDLEHQRSRAPLDLRPSKLIQTASRLT